MAKIRYVIDYVFDESQLARGKNPYVPCGVWAMSDSQFEVGYSKGFEARAEEVDAWLTELVEQGIRPERVEGFLEYWRERRPSLSGTISEIIVTVKYTSLLTCVEEVLRTIKPD